jgi:CubicO group peptidase (beta-lactamase class C family)
MTSLDLSRLVRLDAAFEQAVAGGDIAGAVVGLTTADGTIYLKAFGYRDREAGIAMRDDDIFRTASMTKPVVAATALLLAEEGRLQLGAPVGQYLPELGNLKLGVEADGKLALEPSSQPTVFDLLRQTAGFTNVGAGASLVHAAYAGIASLRDHQQTNAEMVTKLARLPLLYRPGTTFEYGMSMDVLAAILEVVAGTDLNRLVGDRIARPLGMTGTGFLLADEARLAEPQIDRRTGVRPDLGYQKGRPPRWFRGGGGLLSTVPDYLSFCRMLLNRGSIGGRPLLSRHAATRMTTNALPPGITLAPSVARLGPMAPDPALGQGFGLGGMVRTVANLHPWPGSVGDYSWSGRAGTYFWVDPAEGIAAVLMMQTEPRPKYHELLRTVVYSALA